MQRVTAAGADGSSDAAGLLPGLVVGDTRAQPDDLVEDMRTAGLSHLTAVSGANVRQAGSTTQVWETLHDQQGEAGAKGEWVPRRCGGR